MNYRDILNQRNVEFQAAVSRVRKKQEDQQEKERKFNEFLQKPQEERHI